MADQAWTWGMINTKFHLISQGYHWSSIVLHCITQSWPKMYSYLLCHKPERILYQLRSLMKYRYVNSEQYYHAVVNKHKEVALVPRFFIV